MAHHSTDPYDQFILRTPLQSFENVSKSINPDNKQFSLGLAIASDSLHNEQKQKQNVRKQKTELALQKYWLRSCTRATPFASFAGLAAGAVTDSETKIELDSSDAHRIHVRLDMKVVSSIVTELSNNAAVIRQLKFISNNSLYRCGDTFRIAEYRIVGGIRKFELSSVFASEYLKAALEASCDYVAFDRLVEVIQSAARSTMKEAEDFLMQLIDSQVLISELEPAVTGTDPLRSLVTRLEELTGTESARSKLYRIRHMLQKQSFNSEDIEEIHGILHGLGLSSDRQSAVVQADMFLQTHSANISVKLVSEIRMQIEELLVLSKKAKNSDLDVFRAAFARRYENQMVPLSLALDADMGIGYSGSISELSGGSQIIDELPIVPAKSTPDFEMNANIQLALKKYEQWNAAESSIIEITEADLQPFLNEAKGLVFPTSMAIMGNLFRNCIKKEDRDFEFALSNVGGSSAANLLGRFAYGDEKICSQVSDILARDEARNPDVIFAELVHLPQSRTANILFRPVLRDYEIPYLGVSGAAKENQIMLDDLFVTVASGEVVLWSRKNRKRVIPCLTTAHNFGFNSLPVYKFLCDLQAQGLAVSQLWDWGPLESMQHLPRVTYKNIILRKACWIADDDLLNRIERNKEFTGDIINEWRNENRIPSRVSYAEGDNGLLIDFEQSIGIELFMQIFRKHKRIRIEEFLFSNENAVVRNRSGEPFTNEIILPFYPKRAAPLKPFFMHGGKAGIQRSFLPGSEWLYYKVYCGSKTADSILKDSILPFIENGLSKRLFQQFFFLRYMDEEAHFRIRFFVPETGLRSEVSTSFSLLLQDLLNVGRIHKVVCDTYVRELERYGNDTIELTEQLFFNDSLAVLRFMDLLDESEAERYRMLFALRGVDLLLQDFGLSLPEKLSVVSGCQVSFFAEFGSGPALQKVLNEKYRQNQQDIFLHMNSDNDAMNEIEEAVSIFQTRSEMNRPIIAGLKLRMDDERLRLMLPAYIHMFINRIFIAQQRKHELVVYHFLEKFYASQLAIQNLKREMIVIEDFN